MTTNSREETMNDITPPDTGTEITVRQDQTPTLLSLIERVVRDSSLDIEKMERLMAMQERHEAGQARRAYYEAMNLAQAEIQPVVRDTENTQTRSWYAKLESVDAAIRPIYTKHGFSLSDTTVAPLIAGNIRIETTCSHVAGHSERFGREAPADTLGPKGSPTKTVLHGGASTETFLKRYIRCGIFNVVFRGQDDDGVAGGAQYISAEEVKRVSDLLRETGSDLDRFLKFVGVDSLPAMQKAAYVPAMNQLLTLKRRQEERAKGKADEN
jgi:hypothetical protein